MTPDRLYLLAVRHFAGALDPAEAGELAAALRDDAAAREVFAAVQAQILAVAELRTVPPAPSPPAGRPRRGWRHLVVASTAAALLMAVVADALWRWTRPDPRAPAEAGIVATVERAVGTVRAGDGGPPLESGTVVRAGQTLATVGPASALALRRAGGAPLFLGGDTTVTLPTEDQVAVRRGDVAVEVTATAPDRPFEVTTPEARIETRQSKLLVSSGAGRTQVRVLEGTARVEDPVTHAGADMAGGDCAEAAGGKVTVAQQTFDRPDAWAVRLGGAPPRAWDVGLPVADGVRAVPVVGPGGVRHRVVTADGWAEGLFEFGPDSWVSVRLRVDRPGPVRVAVLVRPRLGHGLPGAVLEAPPTDATPGGWRTIHIPARDFRPARGFDGPGAGGGIGCAIALDTGPGDLGLVADRIWVSRGPNPDPGPGG